MLEVGPGVGWKGGAAGWMWGLGGLVVMRWQACWGSEED